MILFSSQIIHGKVQGGMGLGQDGKGLVWGRDMGQVRGGRLGRVLGGRGLGGGQAWGHDKVRGLGEQAWVHDKGLVWEHDMGQVLLHISHRQHI